jgi:hypothetical protein
MSLRELFPKLVCNFPCNPERMGKKFPIIAIVLSGPVGYFLCASCILKNLDFLKEKPRCHLQHKTPKSAIGIVLDMNAPSRPALGFCAECMINRIDMVRRGY